MRNFTLELCCDFGGQSINMVKGDKDANDFKERKNQYFTRNMHDLK